jgi:hypothetical protein
MSAITVLDAAMALEEILRHKGGSWGTMHADYIRESIDQENGPGKQLDAYSMELVTAVLAAIDNPSLQNT